MRCAEVQEQIQQGRSIYVDRFPDACVEEVDDHLNHCVRCRDVVVRERWRRFRRRPSLRGLLGTIWVSRRFKRNPVQVTIVENRPIVRIVNVIIQQAIKERAERIEVRTDRRGDTVPPPNPPQPVPEQEPVSERGAPANDLMAAIKRDIVSYSASHDGESANALRVYYRVKPGTYDEGWYEVMTMPAYVAPPIQARIKSMSELLVCAGPIEQHGRILIRYENQDFETDVHVEVHDGEERILMELRRSESDPS